MKVTYMTKAATTCVGNILSKMKFIVKNRLHAGVVVEIYRSLRGSKMTMADSSNVFVFNFINFLLGCSAQCRLWMKRPMRE